MNYAIYPPIGIARLGNSPSEFFIGSERRGSRGTEPGSNQSEVTSFKDGAYRVKRQAARFHVFEVPDDGTPPRPALLPAGATVRWSVQLVNKKDAIVRPGAPPSAPIRPTLAPGRADRIIDTRVQSVDGGSPTRTSLSGQYQNAPVSMGELRSDAAQRLLVLGGEGKSESPTNAPIGPGFYNNPDWHDDVGDGPVTAELTLPGGGRALATPAWVVVAPPDFAPGCQGVVTLYDVLLQVAIDQRWITVPTLPSFDDHIRPMLERANNLRWVNNGATWPLISNDWTALADKTGATQQFRSDNAAYVRAAEDQLQNFTLRGWQQDYLDKWVAGTFNTGSLPTTQAEMLTRAVLDGTVGQGFFPGIEAGIIVTDSSLYKQPFDFRFDHARVSAGDLTALMALPWQADFLKCNGGWWPAQRPDIAPQANGERPPWARPSMKHGPFAANVMKLGVITPQTNNGGNTTFVEAGRDPHL